MLVKETIEDEKGWGRVGGNHTMAKRNLKGQKMI
jgi:hypothetical protein